MFLINQLLYTRYKTESRHKGEWEGGKGVFLIGQFTKQKVDITESSIKKEVSGRGGRRCF